MNHSKSTLCLPPREFYAPHARSAEQVAARVPPSRSQFEGAFLCFDEATVLDFLQLTPSMPRDLDETNAYIARQGHSPPPYPSQGALGNAADEEDPHLWFWPVRSRRLFVSTTLFAFAARHGFADVVAWLFCARERVARLGVMLAHVFYDTLRTAVYGRHLHIVEILLTSPVFLELMSPDAQQSALDNVLRLSNSSVMWDLLIAHGAAAKVAEGLDPFWEAARAQLMESSAAAEVWLTLYCRATATLERVLRGIVVVDHTVLIASVKSGDPEAVKFLLSHGFVDVDARTADGRTALMVCSDRRRGHHAREGQPEIVRCLLEAGADTTLRDPDGQTALHAAIASDRLACVEALLDHTVATCGAEAIHNDARALRLAFRAPGRRGKPRRRVLKALLARGACASAYQTMLQKGRAAGDVCANPNSCGGQETCKRTTDIEQEREDIEA